MKKNKNGNPVPSIDKLKCPRVLFRLECEKCGYPASEALYTNGDKYCHGVNPNDIICKYDLQNGVETNNEQPSRDNCPCMQSNCYCVQNSL